ncbi:MAG: alpha/beta hydrolase [Campylobacterales bacterium]|nr:alpha/beta hydrolase [Campylobacterales bacterium]
MKENETLYSTVKYILELFEKLFDTSIEVNGAKNLKTENPTLFVANHFTRFETFLLPYLLHNYQKKRVRVIADKSVFVRYLGALLEKIGAVSVDNPKRDEIIISDLIQGNFNWLIFPEGRMVKNKKVEIEDGKYFIKEGDATHKIYTGASYFALKSQWIRDIFLKLRSQQDSTVVSNLKEKYSLDINTPLSRLDTYIVPITINYLPIRGKENHFTSIASKLFKELTPRILEELMVEGALLTNSKVIVNIGEKINIREFIVEASSLAPLNMSYEEQEELILNKQRYKLTDIFLQRIYNNTVITFDHIFACTIYYYHSTQIKEKNLKILLYTIYLKIKDLNKYHIDKKVVSDMENILSDETSNLYEQVKKLALSQNIISENKETIVIAKDLMNQTVDFHEIRIKNTLKVYLNEMSIHKEFMAIIKECGEKEDEEIKNYLFDYLINEDLNNFYLAREKFKDRKPENIGKPRFYDGEKDEGVVIVHGFSSSPKETQEIGDFLNKQGYKIYLVRLDGHGTAPADLATKNHNQWYNSFNLGYKILNVKCKKVHICGFSTGGLIILQGAYKKNFLGKTISINAPLKTESIKIHFVSLVKIWNQYVSDEYKKESMEHYPENPDSNYSEYYFSSISQLKELMEYTEKILQKIKLPTLVIQGSDDPVVDPISGDEIFENISSKDKKLVKLNFKNHGIIRGKNSQKVFKEVLHTLLD